VYIRLGRGGEANVHPAEPSSWKIGEAIEMSAGKDVQLLTTSNMLETGAEVARALGAHGVKAGLTSFPSLKPFDRAYVQKLIQARLPLMTIEEHVITGGLGSAVAEIIAEEGVGLTFARFGIPDEFTHLVGSQAYLRRSVGLDPESLVRKILMRLGREA
jgi:transketolase